MTSIQRYAAPLSALAAPVRTAVTPKRVLQRMEEGNKPTGFSTAGNYRISEGTNFGDTRLESGAKIVSSKEVEKVRSLYEGHIRKFESLGKGALADPLRVKIAQLPEIPTNWVAFQRIAALQPAKPIYILSRDKLTGVYRTLGPDEDDDYVIANGFYEFVIRLDMGGTVFVTRGGGHTSIAGDNLVVYAGTCTFNQGTLVKWDNNTGHFRTTPEYKKQAIEGTTNTFTSGPRNQSMFPENLFKEYKP